MPYYSSGKGSAGVLPVQDQNLKTPTVTGADSGDLIASPDFIIQLQQQLADIRNKLSDLHAEKWGAMSCPPMASKSNSSVAGIQKEAQNELDEDELENQEAAIIDQLNNYLYVSDLGDVEENDESDEDEED